MTDLSRCRDIRYTLTGSVHDPATPPESYTVDSLLSEGQMLVFSRMRGMAAADPNGHCNYVARCPTCGDMWGGQVNQQGEENGGSSR